MSEPENIITQNEITKPKYEVVFFVRYYNARPPQQDIIDYFNKYGLVDHVKHPLDKDFVFVFMTNLYTNQIHRRTRHTLSHIINDMPNKLFKISVARSKKTVHQPKSHTIHRTNIPDITNDAEKKFIPRTPSQNYNYTEKTHIKNSN